jgi:hypothetical protein
MLDRKAIMVCGPESSGNRYMERVLIHHGFYGSGEFVSPFDHNMAELRIPDGVAVAHDRIVFHRSFPHGGMIPRIEKIQEELRRCRYKMTAVVMHRNYVACMMTQLRKHSEGDVYSPGSPQEAIRRIHDAYSRIYLSLVVGKIPFLTVCHSDLADAAYVRYIMGAVQIEFRPGYEEFRDTYSEAPLA